MTMLNEDRRRFFRIADAIGVSYKRVDEAHSDAQDDMHEGANFFSLLESQTHSLQMLLSELKKSQPVAAKAIAALDKKLDTIVALMELDNITGGIATHSIQQASISACGIAFPVNENIEPDTQLRLSLLLETSSEQISALGRVVGCQEIGGQNNYCLRVEFVEMSDSDREKLIQHIVQRQGLLLHSLREQMP